MATRTAEATIKGYYYQFDTSILKLLDLNANSDSITIEGIEDIDISTATDDTTFQCKYLSKPTFINSAVREPIILMLDHFINPSTPNSFNYVLYAHFNNETPGNEPTIDITKLKQILTYSENKVRKEHHIDKKITDENLNSFLSQFKFVFGKEFYEQQQEVIQKLKSIFNCSDFEADILYYNNALRIVIDKAIKSVVSERVITKSNFIEEIDCKKKLFNEWFIKLRSKKEYLRLVAQNLKSTGALKPIRTKMIVIGKEILTVDDAELPIKTFIDNLITKYYKLNSIFRNIKPLAIILDCDSTIINSIKRDLITMGLTFNDGYESISFSSQHFNQNPIINTGKNGEKILKSSYLIKIISRDCLLDNISSITRPDVLLNFSKKYLPTSFTTGQYFDLKYCDNLIEINRLLII